LLGYTRGSTLLFQQRQDISSTSAIILLPRTPSEQWWHLTILERCSFTVMIHDHVSSDYLRFTGWFAFRHPGESAVYLVCDEPLSHLSACLDDIRIRAVHLLSDPPAYWGKNGPLDLVFDPWMSYSLLFITRQRRAKFLMGYYRMDLVRSLPVHRKAAWNFDDLNGCCKALASPMGFAPCEPSHLRREFGRIKSFPSLDVRFIWNSTDVTVRYIHS
jgi:hypothetical protein